MKKTLIILISALFLVYALFSFWDYNSDYLAEKTLWKINQQYMPYLKEPSVVPKATFTDMIQEYEKFIIRFPDSRLVPLTQVLIGRVYMAKEEYVTAREKFEDIIRQYSSREQICVESLLEITQTYILEKDSVNVLRMYERLIAEYPLTEAGLQSPLLIAKFFAEQKDASKAQEAFNDALIYYKKLASDNPNTLVEFNALRLTANCYAAQKQWKKAVMTFGDILLKFPGEPMNVVKAKKIVRSINNISIYEMKDYDLPISIYKQFIEKYTQHPLNGTYEAMIRSLESLKEKIDNE